MENGHAKEVQQPAPPEARCWIEKGILTVQVPLFMPNGEFIAYGMLHKAMTIVSSFFRHIEKEAAEKEGPRILTPAGAPLIH